MKNILTKVGVILGSQYVDKPVDNEFLKAIFDDVVAAQGTYEYVSSGITFDAPSPIFFATAAYIEKDKKIKLFSTAERDANYEVAVYIKTLPKSKCVFAANLLRVISLLHELEHVKQKKIMDYDDSHEAEMLRMCRGRQEYLSTYDVIPAERFAEGNALNYGLEILASSGLIVPRLEEYLTQKRYSRLYSGYEDVDEFDEEKKYTYPLDVYMTKHSIEHSRMSIDESVQTEPILETRLYYGMPITMEERLEIRKKAGLGDSKNNVY